MEIILMIKEAEAVLFLKKENKLLDQLKWSENLDLSDKLLKNIKELLFRNKLNVSDIIKMSVRSNMSSNHTTMRIANVVANTFNFKQDVN